MNDQKREWLEDLEIENANIKWGFSRFDGRADAYNEEGNPDFVIIIPPEQADELRALGWNVRQRDGYEEGDPPENHLQVKISYRFEAPPIYFIKNGRRYAVEFEKELKEIKKATCENIDVIISPSPWVRPDGRSGYTAYVKEMYVTIKESRFASRYAEFEPI